VYCRQQKSVYCAQSSAGKTPVIRLLSNWSHVSFVSWVSVEGMEPVILLF
jgi:hypothetical protein